jgi:hypothetical protein
LCRGADTKERHVCARECRFRMNDGSSSCYLEICDTGLSKSSRSCSERRNCLNIPELFPIWRVSVWIELWMRAGDALPVLEDAE